MNGRRALAFANSNLGIWLLSTVVVGLVSFGYATLTSYYQAKERHEEIVRKLKIEVLQRLVQMEAYGHEIDQGGEEVTRQAIQAMFSAPSDTKELPFRFYSAFPEFSQRPIVSIIVELDAIETKEGRKALEESVPSIGTLMPKSMAHRSKEEVEAMLKQMFDSPYWKVE